MRPIIYHDAFLYITISIFKASGVLELPELFPISHILTGGVFVVIPHHDRSPVHLAPGVLCLRCRVESIHVSGLMFQLLNYNNLLSPPLHTTLHSTHQTTIITTSYYYYNTNSKQQAAPPAPSNAPLQFFYYHTNKQSSHSDIISIVVT